MFYIYHAPGVKIGCSQNIKKRMQSQKFTNYEILEEHYDVFEASNREIELQKQYGYKVDRIPYWQSRKMGKSGAGGRVAVESGQLASIRTKENQINCFKDVAFIFHQDSKVLLKFTSSLLNYLHQKPIQYHHP